MKHEDLQDFYLNIEKTRDLLTKNEIFWAIDLSQQILKEIDQKQLSNTEKIFSYNSMINLWEEYITRLSENLWSNWPYIYNAYNQVFAFAFRIQDHERIGEDGIRLIKILIANQFANNDQIANVLESIASLILKSNNYKKALELTILAIFFKGRFISNLTLKHAVSKLEKIFKKLQPNQRPLLLDSFLNNIYTHFFPSTSEFTYSGFVQELYQNILTAAGGAFRDGILQVKKMQTLRTKRSTNLDDLQEIIRILFFIHEGDWAFSVLVDYVDTLVIEFRFDEAKTQIQEFIQLCYKNGAYKVLYSAGVYLSEFLNTHGNQLQNWGGLMDHLMNWSNIVEKLRPIEDKSLFIKSIARYKKYLIRPLGEEGITQYLINVNTYYKLIRGHIEEDLEIFWTVVLHRAVYEEGFEDLANIAISKLNLTLHPAVPYLIGRDIPKTLQNQKEFREKSTLIKNGIEPTQISIKLRIRDHEPIKLYSHIQYSAIDHTEQIQQYTEQWEDPILKQFYPLFPQFGKLAFLFLPQKIRAFISNLKTPSLVPEILVIQETPDFPFEILEDGKSTLGSRFSFGYRNREPPLLNNTKSTGENTMANHSICACSFGDFNRDNPKIWDEKEQKAIPILRFSEGSEQQRYISMKIKENEERIKEFIPINTNFSTNEEISKIFTSGKNHIIHISSTMMYLPQSPLDSYFISHNDIIISCRDMTDMLKVAKSQNVNFVRPIIIFDGRVLKQENSSHLQEITHPFKEMSYIGKEISSNLIVGFLARISAVYIDEIRNWLGAFLDAILLGETFGNGILNANRRLFLKHRKLKRGLKENTLTMDEIKILNRIKDTPYVLFGNPFEKL